MEYQIAWENGTGPEEVKAALDTLHSRRQDFEKLLENSDGYEDSEDYLPPLHEYGLSLDRHENDEGEIEYVSYVLSTGGPHDEIRFFPSGKIEFVYLPWFKGIAFDVTHDPIFASLRDYLDETL